MTIKSDQDSLEITKLMENYTVTQNLTKSREKMKILFKIFNSNIIYK